MGGDFGDLRPDEAPVAGVGRGKCESRMAPGGRGRAPDAVEEAGKLD